MIAPETEILDALSVIPAGMQLNRTGPSVPLDQRTIDDELGFDDSIARVRMLLTEVADPATKSLSTT